MLTIATINRTRTFWRRAMPAGNGDTSNNRTHFLFTMAEACSALRVSRWMLYQLIRSRQLTTIKIGRRRFVPRDALEALIERLSNEGTL